MRGTQTEENYLKAIYKLSQIDNSKISLTAVAEEMQVNSASVIDMLKKLVSKNFITYDKKSGVALAERGSKAALHIIRKHRLWEVFLHEKLHYNWDEIHDMAEQLEHIHHDDLADRLDVFLDHPDYDPHGDPIPKSNGKIPAFLGILLKDLGKEQSSRVVGVRDTSSVFLQYLAQLSVGIGSRIQVLEMLEYDGSMSIKIDDATPIIISEKIAENIYVER